MTQLIKKKNIPEEITFEEDKLNRRFVAENFNLIFSKTSQPFVVALDSPWGTGKTQFIYMWRNLLKESKKVSIYLNIWEEDFLRNPFFSLTEALCTEFEKEKIGESQIRKDIKKIGWEVGRAAVSKVFNLDINNLVNEDYNKKQRENKNKFKEKLSELAKKTREKTNFPLIIFIDELDRCRPDYAVEFLEIIKHFFDVEDIIFVLGVDIEQLQHSVKSLYGVNMEAKEYLRKFIDIDYSFSEPLLDNYLELLFSEFNCGKKEASQILVVKEIIKKFNPSLRAVEKLFVRLNLIEEGINLSYIEASFLLSLKIFDRKNYDKLVIGGFDVQGVLNFARYFDLKGDNLGKIIFWKLSNDLILKRSKNEIEYLHNLQKFFSDILLIWSQIGGILSQYSSSSIGFREVSYCYNGLLKVFLEDVRISKQQNIDSVKSIFRSKEHYFKEFKELIQKIDFLEGLEFGDNKNETTNKK